MTTNFLRFTLLGAVCVSVLAGQSDAGRIIGVVTDTSGSVVPGASVTVKNENTGQTRNVSANERGAFVATPLPPSVYSVKAESPGMAAADFTGIRLQVGQE